MSGYFELKASGRQFTWNLKAANHEVILTSELYKTHESALNGIASTKKCAKDDKRYDRRASKDGQFYFVPDRAEWADRRQKRAVQDASRA